MILQRSMAKAV